MALRRGRICRSLCGNSSMKDVFLGLVVISLAVILSINHPSLTFPRHKSRISQEYLVNWQPSLNDSNVSLILEEHKNPYRPLIFVPFPHTGSDFVSFVIKQRISAQNLDVKMFDFKKSGTAASRKAQIQEMQKILTDEREDQLIFIESNVINLNIQKFDKEPILVSLIRDPFEVLLSCYHQKKYGNSLYRAFDNFTESEFKDRLNNLTVSLEKCVLRNKRCMKDLLGTFSMVKSFSGMPLSTAGSKRNWANKAMPRAKTNIAANGVVVGVMEDFQFVPFMLERIAPKICQYLWQFFNMHKVPPWAFTATNISDRVKDIIKENDLNMLLEHHFYNWVKARYERSKEFGFGQFIK